MLPDTFKVEVIDKATDQPMTLTVSRNAYITSQEQAEEYVRGMPTSFGGKHPGLEVARTGAAK